MTVILAFDSSEKSTGFAIGRPGGPVETGSFSSEVQKHIGITTNYGRIVDRFAERAWPLIEVADVIYFEAPILPFGKTNVDYVA